MSVEGLGVSELVWCVGRGEGEEEEEGERERGCRTGREGEKARGSIRFGGLGSVGVK